MRKILIPLSLLILALSCTYDQLSVTSSKCTSSTLAITVSESTQASSCSAADGSITVAGSGGSGTYTYSLNGGTYQSSTHFYNLAIGSYSIAVKDSLGCSATTTASVTNASSSLAFTVATTINTGCPTANGAITVSATGGTAPYQYKLNSGSYQSSNSFTGLSAGTYTVTVSDASNCPISSSATVTRSGPSFSSQISSIISTKCSISGCHNGSHSPTLTTYSNISANASQIKSVIAGGSMPPSNSSGGSLSTTQINLINCWIADGAPNN